MGLGTTSGDHVYAAGGRVSCVQRFVITGDGRRVTHLLLREERPFRHNEMTIAARAVTGMDGGLLHDLGPNQIEDVTAAVD